MSASLEISRDVVSARLRNDRVPVRSLNEIQQVNVDKFLTDERIHYHAVRKCPLCESTNFVVLSEKDQFGIPLETACCKGCGLLFSLNQLDPASTAIFYDEYYRKIYEGVHGPSLEHGFYKRLFSGAVPPVPSFIDSSSQVFEFGCGGGWNLLPYKKMGIQHAGFDYDSAMIRFGKEKYGLNLFQGGVDEALASGVRADYVILSHVLEHVTDPAAFLESIASIMKIGSLIRITVPCIDYLKYFGGSGTSHDFGLVLQNAHNFTFSEATLRRVVLKAGFVPVVLIGGYCLAKYVGRKADAEADASGEFLRLSGLIKVGEKSRQFKSRIMGALPGTLRSMLLYSYQLTRPVELFKYYLVSRSALGKRLIARVN